MKIKSIASAAAVTAIAGAVILAVPTAAMAAESDISVVYSTQNTTSAPTDGSYTVYSRVDVPRDDMQVTYTIQAATVRYPVPVLEYTGTFVDTADATYSFRFGCDATVAPATCSNPAYLAQIDAMNAAVASFDGRSISTFTADVTPVIEAFGGVVPQGISGTVTAHVQSDVAGNGQLRFFLTEGTGGAALSPTVTAPLVITEPTVTAGAVPAFCVAGLPLYDKDGQRYTPTDFGRTSSVTAATPADSGNYDDDVTPIAVDPAGLAYAVDGTAVAAATLQDSIYALPAGAHTLTASYTAPDGVAAAPADTAFTVLGADAPECYTVTKLPTTPTTGGGSTGGEELAATGGDDAVPGLILGLSTVIAGLGVFLVARRRALRAVTA